MKLSLIHILIHTAKQLKDKVKNMSGGNSEVAQALIRTYFMERFLERVSVSEYRNNFILKGGMLVASIVGVDMRATMDIDTLSLIHICSRFLPSAPHGNPLRSRSL